MMRAEAIHVIYDGHGLFCFNSLGLFQSADGSQDVSQTVNEEPLKKSFL